MRHNTLFDAEPIRIRLIVNILLPKISKTRYLYRQLHLNSTQYYVNRINEFVKMPWTIRKSNYSQILTMYKEEYFSITRIP